LEQQEAKMSKIFFSIFIFTTFLFAQERSNEMATFKISSPAFANGEEIPRLYTCQGDNISPALAWDGAPEKTKSFVLIAEDPDAPDPAAPRITWIHWILYNIPASARFLKEGIDESELPAGTRQGINSWGKTGYGGPCPPIGRHRYFFKLYALDSLLPELGNPTKAELLKAMKNRIIAETELMGTYMKK